MKISGGLKKQALKSCPERISRLHGSAQEAGGRMTRYGFGCDFGGSFRR
jgi:hypothetical protein